MSPTQALEFILAAPCIVFGGFGSIFEVNQMVETFEAFAIAQELFLHLLPLSMLTIMN